MQKKLLISSLILMLSISICYSEGPYLILSNYSQGSEESEEFFRALGEEDFRYVYDRDGNWQNVDFDGINTIFLSFNWGLISQDGLYALFDFAEAGGKFILSGGGDGNQAWAQWFSEYIPCRYQYEGPGGWRLVDPDHPLAEELPEQQDVYTWIARTFIVIDHEADPDFNLVGVNNSNYPSFGAKQIGRGEFIYLGMFMYTGYYNSDPNARPLVQQMIYNAINYTRGSKVYGTVTNATTHNPVYEVAVSVYDQDADTLMSTDYTDSSGYYECSTYLLEDRTYYITYSKHLYVHQETRDLVGIPPDNYEMNINLTPFLQTDIEALQIEVPLGTWVDVTGIVTVPTNSVMTEHTSFYIQDETQYGIHVYDNPAWDAEMYGNLNRGDEVRIVGRLDEYDSITEINSIYLWEVLSTGNDMPEPLDMPTGTMRAMQEMEGTWAHIVGYMQNDPAQMGSYTFGLNDGSGECQVRIEANTLIDLRDFASGDWQMVDGVISIYEGEVQIIPAMRGDVYRTPMISPDYSRHDFTLDEETMTGTVEIRWDHEQFGHIDKLAYDNGPPAGYYTFPGNKLGVRVSPMMNCRLIAIKMYLWAEEAGTFNAQLFNWDADNNRPGDMFRDIEIEIEPMQGWYEFILSDENIQLNHDFIIAFSSEDDVVRLGVNHFDNGRAWDYDGAAWQPWVFSYYIRAIVQYPLGNFGAGDETGDDELDAYRRFKVYRNNVLVDSTQLSNYTDILDTLEDGYGEYVYTVTAVYHEGETPHSDPEVIDFTRQEDDRVIESNGEIPADWAIISAFPNPFNPTVSIRLAVPVASEVKLQVFDILGRNVAVINPGQLTPGYHAFNWTASGTSGTYFVKASSSTGWSDIRKMVYMK